MLYSLKNYHFIDTQKIDFNVSSNWKREKLRRAGTWFVGGDSNDNEHWIRVQLHLPWQRVRQFQQFQRNSRSVIFHSRSNLIKNYSFKLFSGFLFLLLHHLSEIWGQSIERFSRQHWISNRFVFLIIHKERLLEIFVILLTQLRYICCQIWECISDVLLTPYSRVQKYLENRLFFYQHLRCFIWYSLGDFRSLSIINPIGRRLPVILQWHEMRRPYKSNHIGGSLHDSFQQSSEI